MKNLIICLILLSMSFFAFSQTDSFPLNEEMSNNILNSSEAEEFINVHFLFLEIINEKLNRGIEIETIENEFANAIRTGNNSEIFILLFGDVSTGDEFFEDLSTKRRNFLSRFDFIENNLAEFDCRSTTSNLDRMHNFFNNFQVYFDNRNELRKMLQTERVANEPPVCGSYWNQVKLLACSGICGAATAGIGSVGCVWGCWCTFCTQNSAVASTICEN